MPEIWPHPSREETHSSRLSLPQPVAELTDGMLADLHRLNDEGTPAPWAWREAEANGKKPNSKVVFALAGFSHNDEPSCHYFQQRVLQLRWCDVGKRIKQLINVSPSSEDKALIVAMRNALPALLAAIEQQRQRIAELEASSPQAQENPR